MLLLLLLMLLLVRFSFELAMLTGEMICVDEALDDVEEGFMLNMLL